MNSNKQNSNNFLLGVSSNKNNSLEKINNIKINNESLNSREKMNNNNIKMFQNKTGNTYSNTIINNMSKSSSPLETKKIVFGIIDKLENDIVKLNNKINSLNKEKIELKNLSNKEIKTLKEVIKKLYMILSSFYNYKSSNLSKNDRIELLHKLKNTIEENNSFLEITNKIVRNDKSFNTVLNNTLRHNNMSLMNESINKNNGMANNNVSLSNIIARKNSEAKEVIENNSRMNDNAFLKRENVQNNSNTEITGNIPSNNSIHVNNIINESINESSNNSRGLNNSTVSNNLSIKELSNNKNMYKSENKELTQSKKIPLITKIEEHKINQERANRNFNEYKKYL
jgi:hypothetical protein